MHASDVKGNQLWVRTTLIVFLGLVTALSVGILTSLVPRPWGAVAGVIIGCMSLLAAAIVWRSTKVRAKDGSIVLDLPRPFGYHVVDLAEDWNDDEYIGFGVPWTGLKDPEDRAAMRRYALRAGAYGLATAATIGLAIAWAKSNLYTGAVAAGGLGALVVVTFFTTRLRPNRPPAWDAAAMLDATA